MTAVPTSSQVTAAESLRAEANGCWRLELQVEEQMVAGDRCSRNIHQKTDDCILDRADRTL